MKKYIYIIIIVLILTLIIIHILFNKGNMNNNLEININEKILLETSVINWNIINNNVEEKYLYSFLDDKIYINNENYNFLTYDNKLNWNIKIKKWNLYINWKKKFSCNSVSCKYYFDSSWKYIIFIDKVMYKEFIFKKLLAFNSIRVFDLEKNKFKDFPILEFNWEKIDIQWIKWYTK